MENCQGYHEVGVNVVEQSSQMVNTSIAVHISLPGRYPVGPQGVPVTPERILAKQSKYMLTIHYKT